MARIFGARALRIWPASTQNDATPPALAAASQYSDPIKAPKYGGRFSIQLIWTAGPTGAFTLQYTLKADPNLATDADWVTDTSATVAGTSLTVAGGAGNAIVFGGNVLPEWIRIKWTYGSGSASTVLALARSEGDDK